MKGDPFVIELKPDAVPVKQGYPRPMSFALSPKLREELDNLLGDGMISAVNRYTDWVSPIVCVPRKGSSRVRLCVDFTDLNRAINREYYYSPSPQVSVCDIPKAQARWFSKLDCRLGYHQVPLDEKSKDLTTFITCYGKFRFERAPFGVCSIAEVFNRKMEQWLQTYRHVNERRATDDCLLFDGSFDAHVKHVREFLQRCREGGITIAPNKFDFAKKEVIFAGYHVSNRGYRPAAELVGPLQSFPSPRTITDLRAFLGLCRQFGEAAPQLAVVTEPLRHLLQKSGKDFCWTAEHEATLQKTKRYLSSVKLLEFFDIKLPTRLITDASRVGVGYVLQQKHSSFWKPVACGSRYITKTEANYSVIELELLGIVYAILRCKMFLLGLGQFEVLTDHRPLIPVLNKQQLDEVANPRLRRLKTKIMAFNYHAAWVKGRDNLISDYLSRNPVVKPVDLDAVEHGETEMASTANSVARVSAFVTILDRYSDQGEDRQFRMINSLWSCPAQDCELPLRLEKFREECEKDEIYCNLRKYISAGFPDYRNELPLNLRVFWKYRSDLSVERSLIVLYTHRFFVPEGQRETILSKAHVAHQGESRFIWYMAQFYFWPGMTVDCKQWVKSCAFCQDSLPSNKKQPPRSLPPLSYPMEELHLDAGVEEGQHFVGIQCRFSGLKSVLPLKDLRCSTIVAVLKEFLGNRGKPSAVYTDGGTHFTGHEMKEWLAFWDIRHHISSPGWPQSNAWAEAGIKSSKAIIQSVIREHGRLKWEKVQDAVVTHNNTPPSGRRPSPAVMVYGRPMADRGSLMWDHIQYDTKAPFCQVWAARADQMARHYEECDGGSGGLVELQVGDCVSIQNRKTKKWTEYGQVVRVCPGRARYGVLTTDNVMRTKNRGHLRLRKPRSKPAPASVQAPTPPTPPVLRSRRYEKKAAEFNRRLARPISPALKGVRTIVVHDGPSVEADEAGDDGSGSGRQPPADVMTSRQVQETVGEIVVSSEDDTMEVVAESLRMAKHYTRRQLEAKVRILQNAILVRSNESLRKKLRGVAVVESASSTLSESSSVSDGEESPVATSTPAREGGGGGRGGGRRGFDCIGVFIFFPFYVSL